MSPPPRAAARSVPIDDASLELGSKRVTWLKVLLGVVAAAAFFGFSARVLMDSMATGEQLEQVRAGAAAERSAIRADVDHLRTWAGRVIEGNRWRNAALSAIAEKVGAFVPPPPLEELP